MPELVDRVPCDAAFPSKLRPLFEAYRYKILHGGRGGSKCLGLGTEVLMHDGTLQAVENIAVGDLVMGPDSQPRRVLETAIGESELYLVRQTSAMDYVVNEDHVLSLRKSRSCTNDTGGVMAYGNLRRPRGRYPDWPYITNIPIQGYLSQSKRWKENFRGYRAGRFEFEEQSVPVDPYLLGVWLGDGLHRELMVTSADHEIVEWMEWFCGEQNLRFTVGGKPGNGAKDYRLAKQHKDRFNHIWDGFKELGVVSNKHIPQQYITNSVDVRLKLLAGLIDTDGSYKHHGYEITSSCEVLAYGIKRLADSLGFRTSIHKHATKCGDFRGVAWRIFINGATWGIPVLIERKKYKHNGIFPNKDKTLSYLNVESIGRGKYAGFTVDGDRLFCLADGTVTHNSWGAARALLTIGVSRPIRVLCAREIMHTIKESVHQLLKDQIENLGFEDFYDSTEKVIAGANGTQFIFTGLRALTAANIKSFEGMDYCWVEEGQAVSRKSWGVLIPTIRKEGSEIWVTFNPELDTDDTYVRFVERTPPEAVVIKINWRDNPWFTKILNMERLHCKATEDEETYNNIWEGVPRTVLEGAIYAKQVLAMVQGKRFRSMPYDPQLPVHTVWDMGWNDQNSVIFVQKLRNEVMIIDYMEASFLTLSDWVKVMDKLPYSWGTDWLPWDGAVTSRQTGKSDKQILKALGRKKVRHQKKETSAAEKRITASRTMFPRVYMDDTPGEDFEVGELVVVRGCGRLMECMKRYRRNVPTTTDEPATPVHDEFCHGADGFGLLATIVNRIKNDGETQLPKYETWAPAVKGVM